MLLVQGEGPPLHGDLAGSYFLTTHGLVPLARPPHASRFVQDQLASRREAFQDCIGRGIRQGFFVWVSFKRGVGVRVEERGEVFLLDGLFIGVDLSAQPRTAALALGLHALCLSLLQERLLEIHILGRHQVLAHLLAKPDGGCMWGSIQAGVFSVDVLLVALVTDGSERALALIGIDAGQPAFDIS